MSNNNKVINDTMKKYIELHDKLVEIEGDIRGLIAFYAENNLGILDIKFFTDMYEDFFSVFLKKTDQEFSKTYLYSVFNDDAQLGISKNNEAVSGNHASDEE